jgi:ataxia telangiectasia mutated family protein
MSSGTADEAADRALSSVARRLDKALSVEYTVNELIAEATDPVNLAAMYQGVYCYAEVSSVMAEDYSAGWSPHL